MADLHRLLRRQLKRHGGNLAADTPLQPLLTVVSDTYQEADEDRRLMERSLDLTSEELLERNEQLSEQLALLNASLAASRNGLVLLDAGGDVEVRNQQFDTFWQLPPAALEDRQFERAITEMAKRCYNGHVLQEQYERTLRDPLCVTQCSLELSDGRFIECDSRPREFRGKAIGRIWNFHDITDLRKQQQQALHYSMHDYLTDLPNRFLFSDRLDVALRRNRRSGNELGLLFLDLDGFKHINDTLGHEQGDKLLVEIAARLQRTIRDNDTLARHGGDEFLVLLESVDGPETVKNIGQRLLEQIAGPARLGDMPIHITGSIGAALSPQDSDQAEELIRYADLAMYEAKRLGRNQLQFFSAGMAQRASDHLTFKNRMREALAKREFFLLYQPKIDLENDRVVGAEALVRWRQEDGTVVMPDSFIPAAENTGLIIPLSEWIIRSCCRQLSQWHSQGLVDYSISINISPVHFQQGDLIGTVKSALEEFRVDPSAVELEVTENAIIPNMRDGIEKLSELRQLGVKVSIDDFGTGYSSFSYLKSLPIDAIKIDRSFVSDVRLSKRDAALVNSIIDVAHTLGLAVVAEGVETDDVAEIISQHGCDFAQGYLFAKPIDAESCFAFSRDYVRTAGPSK